MADTKTAPTIVGVFADQSAAEAAVERLSEDGFSAGEVGLIAPGEAKEPDYLRQQVKGLVAGGTLGGVAGAVLGAVSVGAIPGVGPVLAAGAIVPVVVGLVTGASAGGTMGSLFAAAATQDQGLHFMQEVRSGRSLITVTTDRVAEATEALERAGALEVADVGRSETASRVVEESDQEP
jgi:hypothetical protein